MSPEREPVKFTGLWIAATAFLLGAWGVLTVLSARSGAAEPLAMALRQLYRLLLALAAMVLAWRVPFPVYRKLTPLLGGVAWLPMVVLPWLGVRIHGMRGWLEFAGLQYQPSELAKPFFLLSLLYFSHHCRTDRGRLWTLLGITELWTAPILAQPDLGTAVVYWGVALAVIFLTVENWVLLAIPGTLMAAAIAICIGTLPYAWRRLSGFWDPSADLFGSGWHIRQFQLAMAHGHWFGAKMRQAVWSNYYLPLSHSDSAYATMVETLGVLGSLPALLLVLALVILLFKLARQCGENRFARGFVAGTAILFLWQSLLHLGVNATLLPPTGLTWPFISYGGSSLLGCGLLLGIALSAGEEESAGE